MWTVFILILSEQSIGNQARTWRGVETVRSANNRVTFQRTIHRGRKEIIRWGENISQNISIWIRVNFQYKQRQEHRKRRWKFAPPLLTPWRAPACKQYVHPTNIGAAYFCVQVIFKGSFWGFVRSRLHAIPSLTFVKTLKWNCFRFPRRTWKFVVVSCENGVDAVTIGTKTLSSTIFA